jgi:hypothetical protein
MSVLARTNSSFVAPAPRAIGEPNMSLEYDHRQKHPGSLYTDTKNTHFNTPNGSVHVPRPLTLGSDDWKVAQFIQKQCEAEADGVLLSSSQIKRFKTAINKTAQVYIDKAHDAQVAKQIDEEHKKFRKEQKKARHLLKKQETAQVQLRQEADTLYEQCEKLKLSIDILPTDNDQSVIHKCQQALLRYQSSPLTSDELLFVKQVTAQQIKNISADARASEIFRDVKTGHITADQSVEGEDTSLPKKKKKKNNKKNQVCNPKISTPIPEVHIDWGDAQLAQTLTKKQQREIALNNKTANSA